MNEPGPQRAVIDLNADIGEGFGRWPLGDDEALLGIVSSANVACGFHAGDPTIMRRVSAVAARQGVAIGAQVGYRDLAGFGRRFIDMDPDELANDVLYQLAALDGVARAEGSRVSYLKPHGALYNAIVHHQGQAAALVEAVLAFNSRLPVYGLPGSVWLAQATAAGLTTVAEAFIDRAYTADGTLVSRRLPGAVLHNPDLITARVVQLVTQHTVQAEDGSTITVAPQSLCLHGDSADAVSLATLIRTTLDRAGIAIGPVC